MTHPRNRKPKVYRFSDIEACMEAIGVDFHSIRRDGKFSWHAFIFINDRLIGYGGDTAKEAMAEAFKAWVRGGE